jgi:Protein of unknown function (DUF1194)
MRRLAVLAALTFLISPAFAADLDVDLQLVLAVDVSRSMDVDEQRLQRDGYFAAFRHPDVLQAIADGALGRIAVSYVEWAGPGYNRIVGPWTVIASPADAEKFAAKLAAASFSHETGTSISSGLAFAAYLLEESGFNSVRQAIDVSGDGPNNAGMRVVPARDAVVSRGITINGLPIILKTGSFSPFNIANLGEYYRECVIGGPGAFMVTVADVTEFERAIRQKLVLEISGLPPRILPAADTVASPPIDCTIGEKTRGQYMYDFGFH